MKITTPGALKPPVAYQDDSDAQALVDTHLNVSWPIGDTRTADLDPIQNLVSVLPNQVCIWSDVDDLFHYARHITRPSGIQRVTFELNRQLWTMRSARQDVRFVRHAGFELGFVEVSWSEVDSLFRQLMEAAEPAGSPCPTNEALPSRRRPHRLLTRRLPDAVRIPLGHAVWFAGQSLVSLTRAVLPTLKPSLEREPAVEQVSLAALEKAQIVALAAQIRPNDLLLTLGSSWSNPDYATLVKTGFLARGALLGVLVHDLIPLRRPEWFAPELVRGFRDWFTTVAPLCSAIFAVSRATAADVQRCASTHAIVVPAPQVIRMATGFGQTRPAPTVLPGRDLPAAGSYILMVSTLEARKNHALLLRVWRQMLDDLPRDDVPTLVLAGRIGWLVGDLMQQLRSSNYLDGKVMLIEMASDEEIEQLYRGCLFTIFPSLYEGWGLPVTESLAFGKPCLAADNTSLPEAGGDLARYFNAGSVSEAYAAVCGILADRAGLAAWQDRIVREYHGHSWRQAAETVFDEARRLAQG